MSRFVPASKYRSLVALSHAPQETYCDLNVAEVTNNSTAIAASSTSVAFVAGGGSDVGYLPMTAIGKGQTVSTLSGHTDVVLHLDFASTHPDLLLSCSQDCSAQVWRDGADHPVASLQHADGVAVGRWHPCASELAATVTQKTVNLWDTSTESLVASTGMSSEGDADDDKRHISPGGLVWDAVRGSWCVVSGSDKFLRMVDFRRSRSVVGVEASEVSALTIHLL
jgi:WD40 repeat protein